MSYTSQIIEPLRIEMGKLLISHEMIKLLPNSDYEKIKTQINGKWTDFDEVVTVRDFWNLVDSLMMGYKLKNIARELTSQQYTWSFKRAQVVAQLRFSTDIAGLQSNTKTATEIKTLLEKDPAELQQVTSSTQREFSEEDTRHLDPIIILNQNGTLFVHDGNGRLLKAVIENKDIIDAYIGTQNNVLKSNHWIPTAYLQRLADEKCKEILFKILQESDNAIFEFKNRVDVEEEFKREILSEI